MPADRPSVSLIVPSYQRLPALKDTMPFDLAVEGVDEIVVVDDGSTDGTQEWLATIDDPRLRVVRTSGRLGPPGARNVGVEHASGDWVMFGEDDCRLPPDMVTKLLAAARRHDAQIVSAPWLFTDGRPIEEALAEARRDTVEHIELDQVTRFPARDLETPFLCALALIRRDVFDRVRYDPGYGGNAYREETDFFVSAVRAGFRSILTPDTYAYQLQRWPGGVHVPRARYELSSVRNTKRFLDRHGDWLHEHGLAGPPKATQRRFARERVRYLLGYWSHHGKLRVARALRLR
ncbi:glycosyltransferase family 2 protein [Paraconexibacter sp.]|uniref:glycosyltransferase family 2 protein n=1 Tax=Paraconexibacter sp. TaxID=2949640 RepID=UPI00356955D1